MADQTPTPMQSVETAFEGAEARYASSVERIVASDSFGEVLALVAGNTIALTKLGSGVADMVVHNLRLAGRRDVVALGRQLARTEDKLERLLQEVEVLQDELRRSRETP